MAKSVEVKEVFENFYLVVDGAKVGRVSDVDVSLCGGLSRSASVTVKFYADNVTFSKGTPEEVEA